MGLSVGVYVKGDILILRLKGELDDMTVNDLRKRVTDYIDGYNIRHLVINFQNLEFLDSSGIGFIIGRYHQIKKRGGDITICNIPSKLERLISISGLYKICIIRESESALLLSMGEKING